MENASEYCDESDHKTMVFLNTKKRKRGMNAVLSEVQVTGEQSAKRKSLVEANLMLSNSGQVANQKKPRGNPEKAVKIKHSKKQTNQ